METGIVRLLVPMENQMGELDSKLLSDRIANSVSCDDCENVLNRKP